MDIKDYVCPDCGADCESVTQDCCDTCVLKFFFENVFASKLNDYKEDEIV